MMNLWEKLQSGREEGFTLVEIMVAVVILGILGTVSMSLYNNNKVKAHQRAVMSDIEKIAITIQQDKNSNMGKFLQYNDTLPEIPLTTNLVHNVDNIGTTDMCISAYHSGFPDTTKYYMLMSEGKIASGTC